MCGLCGALGGEDHWTISTMDPEAAHHERRRVRAYRVALINRVLASWRVQVEDFQATSYILTTATGKREIVQDLGGIWQQVESMTNGELDPLDLDFLQSLSA